MFERNQYVLLQRVVPVACMLYLLPVTGLYALLLLITFHAHDLTGRLFQMGCVFGIGPPLLALWATCIVCVRRPSADDFRPLPRSVVVGLAYGVLVVLGTAIAAGNLYPWGRRTNPGFSLAAMTLIASPAAVVAIVFLRAHHVMGGLPQPVADGGGGISPSPR
ncbi:MAG: hypothetical protein RLZZ618_2159 [Pseudomonadota bacterium]|jgi:hypothetical protein